MLRRVGRVKISDLSTWVDGSDPSDPSRTSLETLLGGCQLTKVHFGGLWRHYEYSYVNDSTIWTECFRANLHHGVRKRTAMSLSVPSSIDNDWQWQWSKRKRGGKSEGWGRRSLFATTTQGCSHNYSAEACQQQLFALCECWHLTCKHQNLAMYTVLKKMVCTF